MVERPKDAIHVSTDYKSLWKSTRKASELSYDYAMTFTCHVTILDAVPSSVAPLYTTWSVPFCIVVCISVDAGSLNVLVCFFTEHLDEWKPSRTTGAQFI